ncbi:MAG: bifunctional diaminohydroxyphosphoribosylaminopyrimidine deaminase/5-amino-6-(5-phosphoribosylamino)uracil reductase RibD [Spirochaetes bacterium]|nr:bifunctional diaminohydroxyphosphoribosylaminopyrimidine deaminase/5-amino-6-(5-phosphoribosylamino)uracil reductase RibD [Spirochaetota bacterium]
MTDENNRRFMELAFATAFRRLGNTSPNPPVGAVIVRDGEMVAQGGTLRCGSSHAEVAALEAAGAASRGAEMFVTLEPCCHYGKTPPCTEAIIKGGIHRVHIPMLDPNPLVAGKGVAALQAAGIDVVFMHEMRHRAADIYRSFKKLILRRKPFVIHKCAMTMDGRTATTSGDSRWITSEYSRYIVHRLRAKVDAVIVGKNTLLRDNPALTVRMDSFDDHVRRFFEDPPAVAGRNNFFIASLLREDPAEYRDPCRIVMGMPEIEDAGARFFSDDNYIIFETKERLDAMSRSARGGTPGIGRNVVPLRGGTKRDAVVQVLEELERRGVMLILLEGGAALSGSFFDSGEIDQYMYFLSPRIAGNGLPVMAASGFATIGESLPLHDLSYAVLNEEILCNGYRDVYSFEMV